MPERLRDTKKEEELLRKTEPGTTDKPVKEHGGVTARSGEDRKSSIRKKKD